MGGAAGALMKLVKGFGGLRGKLGPPGCRTGRLGGPWGSRRGPGTEQGPRRLSSLQAPPAWGTLSAGNSPDPFILCFNK